MPVPLLDLTRQYEALREEIRQAIDRVCDSQRFILGSEVEDFERQAANALDAAHAVGVTSGTDALLVALMALGIGRGDEVVLPTFTFFASAPLGHNHPRLRQPDVERRLLRAATANPSNSDFYTTEMADFVDTLYRVGRLADLPHLFLIAGGGPAVENALKTAFDWKVQKNLERGLTPAGGNRVLHFEEAFHGRLGYSLSVTATPDDRKTRHFPAFDWPRIAKQIATGTAQGVKALLDKLPEKALGSTEGPAR